MGRAAAPWPFLAPALAALSRVPQDAELRFLIAANLARLGLASLARELLADLPAEVACRSQVAELSAALDRLPPDRVTTGQRVDVCRRNVETLATRGVDLLAALEVWSDETAGEDWFRAADGNVVRRRAAGDAAAQWKGVADHRGAAEQWARERCEATRGKLFGPPYVIEGVDPPWLLERLAAVTPPNKLGFQPRITVVQSDPAELLDGLAHADLRVALADPRIEVFVGHDAVTRLQAVLRERFELEIIGELARVPTLRTPAQPPVETALRNVQTEQQTRADTLGRSVASIYADRDRAWWARRYADASSGRGERLRVLVPTTRFSTYVQHASGDLAESLRSLGCDVRVVIEPDDFAKMSSIAYLSHLEHWQPDLVVLINYTRANTGGLFPAQVPFVCWMQDAMAHQFDTQVGRGQSDLDFVVGHAFRELFESFGYPAEHAVEVPIVVSGRKFHDGPVDATLRRRHTCEIAYVGHQSETPEAQRDRLLTEVRHDPLLRDCLERIHDRLRPVATEPNGPSVIARIRTLITATLEGAGVQPTPQAVARLMNLWVLPMADRILRHETLGWAADVADRCDWRLRIYGRGWDRHPRLQAYACDPLEHGEALRASYRCAAVHLHATINTIRHQRVFECFLSGGLPVARRLGGDLKPILDYTLDRLVRECSPVVAEIAGRRPGYAIADHPDAMSYTAARQRYGFRTGPFLFLPAGHGDDTASAMDREDAWLLGDPTDITFESSQELQRLVTRAVERPAWRSAVTRAVGRRVRRCCTTDRLARRILDLVTRGVTDGGIRHAV